MPSSGESGIFEDVMITLAIRPTRVGKKHTGRDHGPCERVFSDK